MAAITGIVEGTDVVLSIAGTQFTALTSNSLDVTMNTRETTNKDSGASAQHLSTRYTWSVNLEGLMKYDGTYNYEELMTAILAGDAVAVIFGPLVSGNPQWSGLAIITNLSQSNPLDDNSSLTATLLGTGDLTPGTTV